MKKMTRITTALCVFLVAGIASGITVYKGGEEQAAGVSQETFDTHTNNASAHHIRYNDTEATNAVTAAGFVKASVTNGLASETWVNVQGYVTSDTGVTNLVLGTTGLAGNITGRTLALTNTLTDTGVTNLTLGPGLSGNITGRNLALTNTVTDTTFTNRVNASGLLSLEGGIQSGSNTIGLTVATLEAQGFATNPITSTAGNWTGTFDSKEGTGYLDRASHTGMQAASTVSNFDAEVGNHPDVASNTTHRGITSGNPHSVTKSDVGLGSVENTALSTWPGTTNIVKMGVVTSGTWQAGTIAEVFLSTDLVRDVELEVATNANASGNHHGTFDGQEGAYYLNAANLTGTLATARLNITNTHSATKGLFSDNGTNLYWKADTSGGGGGQVESVNGQTGVVTIAAYPTADSNKLAGIAAGATSNSTDAFLLNWANITNHPNVSELGGTIASNEIDWASMPSGLQDGDNVGITVETDPGFAAVSNRVAYTNVANTFAGTQTFFSVAASGTVDGRDVSVDGTKLDGVAAGATSNSTASIQVIATNAVAQASPAINFANRPQINGTNILIPGEVAENPATANLNMAGYKITNIDQAIATDIRSSYQLNLAGVTNVNWDNQTFLTNGGLVWTFGAGSTVAVAVVTATGTMDGRDVSVDGTKLDGIAAGATSNSTDAVLLARANHTGTQTASTVSDFNAAATNAVSAASPGMNFANRMVVGATNTTTNVLFEVAGTAKVSAIYIGTDLISGINTNTGLVVTNTGDFAQFTGLNGANGQVWRANGSGGGSWTNYSRGGVHTITAATNTVTFSPVFSVAPVSVVGSIGSQFDQVASVKILSIATNQFQYAVHGADGLITNAWDIYWIAHP